MPKTFASQAQARLFHAATEKPIKGLKQSVAKKVVKETAGKPIKQLPQHVKKDKK